MSASQVQYRPRGPTDGGRALVGEPPAHTPSAATAGRDEAGPDVGGRRMPECSGRFPGTRQAGCSEAWLSHVLWEHETVGSNPTTPTTTFGAESVGGPDAPDP